MPTASPRHAATSLLLAAASAAVLIGSLKLAQGFIVPILLAAFIATISFPITRWLRNHKVPRFPAVLLTVLVDFAFLTGIILIAISLAGDLQSKWKGENGQPGYETLMFEKAKDATDSINSALRAWGFEEAEVTLNLAEPPTAQDGEPDQALPPAPERDTGFITTDRLQEQLFQVNLGRILDLGTNVAFGILSFIASALLILILTIFMLAEARMFARQAEAICEARGPDLQRILHAAHDIQRYLGIKTLISLATGILAGFLCWAAGLDLYILWGIVAFVLNFVPVVGSIIAGIPPVILAILVQDGPSGAIAIAIGYTAINIFLGNFLEPMLMGRRFGLSTLVVLIAVVFWGWLWGPAGMLLAVPLTMVIKVTLENSEDFRWLAIAMSQETRLPPSILPEVDPESEDPELAPTTTGANKV